MTDKELLEVCVTVIVGLSKRFVALEQHLEGINNRLLYQEVFSTQLMFHLEHTYGIIEKTDRVH